RMKPASDSRPQNMLASSGSFETLLEELACAIANSQAALFSGRFEDLEASTLRQQEVCSAIKSVLTETGLASHTAADRAQQVHQQNLVFSAAVQRMQTHLDTLRNVLTGRSETYDPSATSTPPGAR